MFHNRVIFEVKIYCTINIKSRIQRNSNCLNDHFMKDENNNKIWSGRPSQLVNFYTYLLLFWTVIFPIVAYLKTRFTIYELTQTRLRLKTGIFSQKIEDTELYRVRDYSIDKPFLFRIFGLGHIQILTSDKSNPEIYLYAIRQTEKTAELIRNNVEIARKKSGTREIDYT